jgi:NADP-dependent 3-hydroxy acid dehydrogenase YdfG
VSEENVSPGTAIVVGAGAGLGMAVARAFAAEGHPVALLARDHERLRGYAAELADSGQVARAYRADAGDPDDLGAAINRAIDEFGAPDVLVYNAAVVRPDKPTELSATEWNSRLAVNVSGAKVATDTVLPRLRGGRGTLLFTGGGFALRPSPSHTAMSVSKAALRAYALALFEDQRPSGVHAATVTIAGIIGEPRFEPDSIARRYLELHHQPQDEWIAEILVD